jgi:hypothetical protein
MPRTSGNSARDIPSRPGLLFVDPGTHRYLHLPIHGITLSADRVALGMISANGVATLHVLVAITCTNTPTTTTAQHRPDINHRAHIVTQKITT